MKHDRGTINAKLRAANTGRGTFQEFANEIEAFFGDLQQLKQNIIENRIFSGKHVKRLYDEILGVGSNPLRSHERMPTKDDLEQCEAEDPTEGENQK